MTLPLLLPEITLGSSHKIYRRGYSLPFRQDCLWKIETGVIRTSTWREDGALATLGLWGPGDVVGNVLSTADPFRMECLTTVEAVMLSSQHWDGAIAELMGHIQQTTELLAILHAKPTDLSLLKLLVWLAKKFGQAVESGQLIDLRLTHQDLAELIGSTRVTVTRLINEFEKQGILTRTHQRFILIQEQPYWHYEI